VQKSTKNKESAENTHKKVENNTGIATLWTIFANTFADIVQLNLSTINTLNERDVTVKGLLKSVGLGLPVMALSATAMATEEMAPATEAASTLARDFAPYAPGLAVACSIAALAFAIFFYKKMMSAPEGTETMIEIATHVREGAIAYLVRQYKVLRWSLLHCWRSSHSWRTKAFRIRLFPLPS
jgi:hypothetical protein